VFLSKQFAQEIRLPAPSFLGRRKNGDGDHLVALDIEQQCWLVVEDPKESYYEVVKGLLSLGLKEDLIHYPRLQHIRVIHLVAPHLKTVGWNYPCETTCRHAILTNVMAYH
jgi:hypothetical protein